MLRTTIALLVTVVLAGPAVAWSIRGVELSPTDAARVDRQCDALRFRTSGSLFDSPPPECAHHGDPATDSMSIRPPIPLRSGHLFHEHPAALV